MKIIIVGVKDSRFTNRESGEVISGQSIFFEFEESHTLGLQTDKCFLSESKKIVPVPSLPASASLYYNKYGKVESIVLD